jgi:hypothetical protein
MEFRNVNQEINMFTPSDSNQNSMDESDDNPTTSI